jgi:hypothetical protein
MTEQDKAFEIIKRIRRTKEMSEREATALALIVADEVNSVLWDLEPKVDEDLWLYREMKAKIPYYKGVENVLKKL